jgi:hypothetical protein
MALPLERESHRFGLLGGALRPVDLAIRRADVRASADAGLKPASSAEALPSGGDRVRVRPLSGVQTCQESWRTPPLSAHSPEDDAPREVTMFTAHKRARTTAAK